MASRSPSSESRPLLGVNKQTYNTESTSNNASDSSTAARATPSNEPDDKPLVNEVSRTDLIWILAGLWSGTFLGALDGTIVATLIAPIGSYFNKSNQASYLGTSYLLSVCCFTPLYGRLSDILGRKGAYQLGLTFFGIGTILCGVSPSMECLIAARALAGMGGGGIMTVSTITVTDLIPLKQRGMYQGLGNICFGLGAGLGGPLGGWLNDVLGWKSAFLVQIPVLLFSFTLVTWKVNVKLPDEVEKQTFHEKFSKIDFLGSFTLVGTVGCFLLGFSLKSTEELEWSNPLIVGLLVASVVFCALFITVEKYWASHPMLPLRLITRRTALAVSIANWFGSMAAFSNIYHVPLYFSAVRLSTSSDAGLHLLPHSVAISTGSVFAGWLMHKTGKFYWLCLNSALLTVLACVLILRWTYGASEFNLWFDVVPQGFGMASVITCTMIAMIASVSRADMAVATGITYLFRTTGQVLGVSVGGAVLQAVLARKLRERIQGIGSAELIEKIRHSSEIVRTLDPVNRNAAIASYNEALRVVFICQIAFNVIQSLACMAIEENPLPNTLEPIKPTQNHARQHSDTDA